MLGIKLDTYEVYVEPAHASVYTPPGSPDWPRVVELAMGMYGALYTELTAIKASPRPGLIDALINATIDGEKPDDMELLGVLSLLIGGGFDTTTALTAHALEWLPEHPADRERLRAERDERPDSAAVGF